MPYRRSEHRTFQSLVKAGAMRLPMVPVGERSGGLDASHPVHLRHRSIKWATLSIIVWDVSGSLAGSVETEVDGGTRVRAAQEARVAASRAVTVAPSRDAWGRGQSTLFAIALALFVD